MNTILRSHLLEGRLYRYYVGIPFHSPEEWKLAEEIEGSLFLAGEALKLNDITAFLVVYPNGQVLSAEQEFFPLPDFVKFIEPSSSPHKDVMDPSELDQGRAFAKISFGVSTSRPNEPGYYSTTISNISDSKVRVLRFGGFAKTGNTYQLNTISGDYFSSDYFINWYGVPEDGWILPGNSVTDPNNYGGGDIYWVYYFENENGKEFIAGDRIPQ